MKNDTVDLARLPDDKRRTLLKLLSGIPLFPFGICSPSYLLSAKIDLLDKSIMDNTISVSFIDMQAPSLQKPEEMATTLVQSALDIQTANGIKKSFNLAFESLFVTGDLVPGGDGGRIVAGGNFDIYNRPIVDRSVVGQERQMFSDAPDGSSLLSISDANIPNIKGKPVFAVVQFEYVTRCLSGKDVYGKVPSPIAVLTLDQDQSTGKLTLVKYHNIDTSNVHGLWTTCGASLSPWNTHLSSEEYEPDAFDMSDSESGKQMRAYSKNLFGDENRANPYHYGHIPEVTVNPDGTGSIKKHYCMGRISHELVQVMPDMRTVLMGDDATNGGLFMFVADKKEDLSSGTLYVAKLTSGFEVDTSMPPFPIVWINLGHASSAEIEDMINRLKPQDILDVKTVNPNDNSYTKIFIGGKSNWIRVKNGMEKAAAFLETHRYAALKGGSMAFTKMEGTTINIKDKIAYSSLSYIQDSMVEGGNGWYKESGIALKKAIRSGAVMALNLKGRQRDTSGKIIDSKWVPTDTKALLVGEDIPEDHLGNTSNPDKIGNPDNIKFSEKLRTLFIGEDSNRHVNNFLWAYNVDTHKLSRILSAPAGAESTGLHAVDDINGWMYIMSNFQHAGDWCDIHKNIKEKLDPIIKSNYKDRYGATVGYLTMGVDNRSS
ncbi:MAG: DUF839 domain-containing protein [Campylobacterales bacterium]|nr:DUF839 domain-containing protein [Campylobacterales bacterium]